MGEVHMMPEVGRGSRVVKVHFSDGSLLKVRYNYSRRGTEHEIGFGEKVDHSRSGAPLEGPRVTVSLFKVHYIEWEV